MLPDAAVTVRDSPTFPARKTRQRTVRDSRTYFIRSRRAQEAFWEAFVKEGTIAGACRRMSRGRGASRDALYAWRAVDVEAFEAKLREKHDEFIELVEADAIKRGRKKSDLLVLATLKAYRPAIWGARAPSTVNQQNNIVVDQSQSQVDVTLAQVRVQALSNEELDTLIMLLKKSGVELPPEEVPPALPAAGETA